MGNTTTTSKLSMLRLLGKFPSTEKLEKKEQELRDEYKRMQAFRESEKLQRFLELSEFIESPEFEKRKKEINAQQYTGSEPEIKEKRFRELDRSKAIKNYYALKDSDKLNHYLKFKDDPKLTKYTELEAFFTSPEFEAFKKSFEDDLKQKKQEYKDKLSTFKKLQNKYKWFYKFAESEDLSFYNQFSNTEELQAFKDLEEKAASIDLSKVKAEINDEKKALKQQITDLKKQQKELQKASKEEGFNRQDELNSINQKLSTGSLNNELKQLNFKDTEEYGILVRFKEKQKDSQLKRFFKIEKSKKLKDFLDLQGSDEISEYEAIKTEIESDEFKELETYAKEMKFEKTDEYQNLQEYKKLKKDPDIKAFYVFQKSPKLALYNETKDSEQLEEHEELKGYINTDEFKKEKEYLKVKDKFKLSDEYKDYQEYKTLKKDEDIQWYFKIKDSDKFDGIKKWQETFVEDFDADSVDTNKWLPIYYYGETLLNDSYVVEGSKHFYTKGDNLSVNNSVLSIHTKEEKAKGRVWNPMFGFREEEFNYTSGIINTGMSFRQKYGLFKAKIKASSQYPVYHMFYLLAEKISPEVDIFKTGEKKNSYSTTNFFGNPLKPKSLDFSRRIITSHDYSKDFYIYALEWTPDKLVWKVNDVVVFEQTENIPQEPMYIMLSSGIADTSKKNPPVSAKMDVDWIKVYQEAETKE